jgi:hypothetical protein
MCIKTTKHRNTVKKTHSELSRKFVRNMIDKPITKLRTTEVILVLFVAFITIPNEIEFKQKSTRG